MAGTITIQSTSISGQSGTKVIGPLVISGGTVMAIVDSPFAGAQSNTITVPPGTGACVIVPPPANLIGLTLKGVAGDTGIPIDPNAATLINFATAPPASFVLTSAGAITGNVEISFF